MIGDGKLKMESWERKLCKANAIRTASVDDSVFNYFDSVREGGRRGEQKEKAEGKVQSRS